MKKIVWVACDLDGTLLKFDNQFHIIVPEAITAIWNLIKNNIVFTIVTGRWHTDALKIYNSYQLHDKCRYLVACNVVSFTILIKKKLSLNSFWIKEIWK